MRKKSYLQKELIVGIVAIVIIIGVAAGYSIYQDRQNKLNQQEILCKQFCNSLNSSGLSYYKVSWDKNLNEPSCYCKREIEYYINNKTYNVETTLPYGKILKVEVKNEK